MFGTRRTADFLSKATWALAGALVVIVFLINLVFLPAKEEKALRVLFKKAEEAQFLRLLHFPLKNNLIIFY